MNQRQITIETVYKTRPLSNDCFLLVAVRCLKRTWNRDGQKSFGTTVEEETLRFFYHPDHLGSSSRITDATGKVVQSLEYLPYGEVLLDLRHGGWNTPYLFNAKELDEETGLYYYGARYYNPRLSIWLTPDPMQEKHPYITSYAYTANNPINLIDPNGEEWKDLNGHVIKDTRNIKKFIFYSKEFSKQAAVHYNDGIEKYGIGKVAMSQTSTTRSFTDDWRNMNGKDISEVLIMTHGKNQSIAFADNEQLTSTGDGKTNINHNDATNVQDLPQPSGNIERAVLYMYSCHSADKNPEAHGSGVHRQGALSGTKLPIAYVFAQTFNFYEVRGTAESVNYHYYLPDLTFPFSDDFLQPYPANKGRWRVIYNPNHPLRRQGK